MPQVIRDIFEKELKDYFGVEDVIVVNSGTSALIATLLSLDLDSNSEMITICKQTLINRGFSDVSYKVTSIEKFKDKKILFYSTNEMTISRAILFGKKEKEVYQFIDRYLEKEDIFFDIGANVGVFSIYSSLFKEAKSIAFEPEYSNLYLLKKNIMIMFYLVQSKDYA